MEQFKAIKKRSSADRLNLSTGLNNENRRSPGLIFSTALKSNACRIGVAHNYLPKVLEIQLFDHIIITADSYTSFADEGLL